jgi:hypothetical protein
MDNEFEQLEAELKRLQPMPPSPELSGEVARELGPDALPRRIATWWLWAAALPAAAALAFTITGVVRQKWLISSETPVENLAGDEGLKPVAAENILYAATDEGVTTLADGTPVRRERLNYVDTFTWKNARTNVSLKWSVPREEIRVVPVSFQ